MCLLRKENNSLNNLVLSFFETSAKDNINVKQVFERLVDLICEKMSESLDNDPSIANANKGTILTDGSNEKGGNCNC